MKSKALSLKGLKLITAARESEWMEKHVVLSTA